MSFLDMLPVIYIKIHLCTNFTNFKYSGLEVGVWELAG